MQAKVYAPTIDQRREALKVAERFRPRRVFVAFGVYIALTFAVGWYRSDFVVPFTSDWIDLAVGLVGVLLGETVSFFSKKQRAKWHAKDDEEFSSTHGPIQYRLTEAGFDWWSLGEHMHRSWSDFARFKLTDDLLILVQSSRYDDYWVVPLADLDERLLATVLNQLEVGGAVRVAHR